MRELYVLMDGAPNANYDVELILPSMKNFGVFKRYFMPSQGLLPVIPQVSAGMVVMFRVYDDWSSSSNFTPCYFLARNVS